MRWWDLCGDSFQIGQDQIIPAIAGFESPNGNGAPNRQLACVDFQPTQSPATKDGNVKMVFWVVVWIQDTNGNPVPEMDDHGLTAIPGPAITQITQVATQDHSNNVGMYPVHHFFQILPADAPPQDGVGGSLKSISLYQLASSAWAEDEARGCYSDNRRPDEIRQHRLLRWRSR